MQILPEQELEKELNLGKKDLCSSSLVVPTEGVVIIVRAHCLAI